MALILTHEAKAFLQEWKNPLPYVTAYTSGSTGTPKEIRLLKNDMRASARATIKFFGLNSASLLYLPLSPDYIAGKMQIVRAVEAGCNLITEPPSNYPALDITTVGNEITLLPIVPSQIDGVIASGMTGHIKNMIIGGAPLSPKAEERVINSGIPSYATYGMTETCSHVALRRLGEEWFTALPGFIFSVDHRGCLSISSRTLSFGNLVTNDIVELSSHERFRWLGRYDNVINSGGIKIFPEEIEKRIAHLIDPTSHFYISSRPSTQWGEEAILVTDCRTLPSDILNTIREIVGPYQSPKAIIYDEQIRLTPSQKIIRRKFL